MNLFHFTTFIGSSGGGSSSPSLLFVLWFGFVGALGKIT